MIASIIKEIERIAAPGTKVELLNRIEIHPDTLKESLEKWGQGPLDEKVSIKGAHRVVELDGNCFKSIISLALNYMNPKITPYHEAFHSVQEFLLTNGEKAILAARYPGRNGISSHERQAQAFADYIAQRNRTPLASIRTIKKFIESIAAYLKGVEVTTSDIFEAAYRGDLRKRAETTPFHLHFDKGTTEWVDYCVLKTIIKQ